MAYSTGEFTEDATVLARTLHLAYRRAQFVLARWYAGMNAEITDPALALLMSRAEEIIADYDANGHAKLNTVLAVSDLRLPGDPE